MTISARASRLFSTFAIAALVGSGIAFFGAPPAFAEERIATLVGDLQDEVGCPGDWDPTCAAADLAPTGTAGVYAAEFTLPAGSYQYKVAIGHSWDEAYGLNGGGDNIPLTIAGEQTVLVTFDDNLKRVALQPLGLSDSYTAADEELVTAPVRQPGSDEQFYFVMTDRFDDGDPSNNTAGLGDDRLLSGYDPTDKGFYNGGDIAGLRSQLDYIDGLGTSAIWLTPSFKNKAVQGEGANASAGYHGYWITDFTQIDPHLGTNAELEALIAESHARGIKVYFDIITNHTADVISYAEGEYGYVDQATRPYQDAAGTAFDPADYAGGDTFPELDPATSFPYTPVIAADDADAKVPAWLNDKALYHNRGNSTWSGESVTLGDFDGLDDLMTENPTVVEGFAEVYKGWVDLGIDGFRIDTVKHVNFEFWEQWTTDVLDYAHSVGKPDFFMFGEIYDADPAKLSPYVRKTDMNSVLDFTFQSAAASFAAGNSAKGLQNLYAGDDMYTTPTTSASALPTFLGNHDMGRIGYLLQSAGSTLERDQLAHSLMYLTRGQPVVYYGDEQGFAGAGDGKDKNARQSLFATQIDEYANQPLVTGEALGSVDRFDTDAPMYTYIAELSALRSAYPALARGAQIERYADSGPGVYVFSRVDREEKIEYLVALNNSGEEKTVELTTLTPLASYEVLSGGGVGVTTNADGAASVTVPALGTIVLKADRAVTAPEAAAAITVNSPSPGAGVTGVSPVSAAVDKSVWQETSFAWRVAGSATFTPLGAAEDGTPRVFHDTAGLADGTLIEYRAVSTDAAGQRAAASSYASVGNAITLVPGETPPTEIELVTIPGSHNAAMGCAGDWTPACEAAQLTKRADGIYSGTFDLPAGSFEYKVALNGSWDVNYGAGGVPGGDNLSYTTEGGPVTFYYDPITNYVTSTVNGPILTLPGSFQDQIGCAASWAPDCMAAWLQDLDGDGIYTWATDAIADGAYELKVAHNLGWDENYGQDGVLNGANISFSASAGKLVVFSYDLTTHLLAIEASDPPLPGTGAQRAQWVSDNTIAWPTDMLPAGAGTTDASWALYSAASGGLAVADGAVGAVPGGDRVELEFDPAGLTADELATFPALSGYLALHPVGLDRNATESILTGQLQVAQFDNSNDALTAFTGVQIPGVLDDLYGADASERDLGVTWKKGVPSFALWAPTAKNVDLLVYTGNEPERVAAQRQSDGSWTVAGDAGWKDKDYLYDVSVYVPSTDAVEVNRVTDPYSVALTVNSKRSVIVDLSDKDYRPKQWEKTEAPVIESAVDRAIYELHVRDFSISDETVPEDLRGTYGAFAVYSDGTRRLSELADAGLNTVHLLPTFDIATIEEDRAAQLEPDCDLASFGPASTEQQACTGAVADADGFNWGYDPYHYQVPEGSYAVNPDGGARVAEFRSMVGALHADGLQVVLDEVYNHTSASGQAGASVLDKVVPGYYHRLNGNGAVETSTCCQNVATEHVMAQKLMVDSVVLFAEQYKVDGFRFDLMGHHSKENMLAVRAALDALTLKKNGIDGTAIYLYGEGWNFGEVANNALFEQATQGQLGGTGIGTFSDRLRDAVHGGSPVDGASTFQQGYGTGLGTDPNGDPINGGVDQALADLDHQTDLVKLGLAGNLRDFTFVSADGTVKRGDEIDYRGSPAGYADQPDEVINYVDAHDNETLFDLLAFKLPVGTSMADRVRMNTLSLATAALSQTPFLWHAGTDLLRSKSLDRDSYNSGDWFNTLDWSGQSNNFGVGLPPAAANEGKWPIMTPLLENPALKPTPDDITAASEQALQLLELKQSSELFRLGSAELIEEKVTFPGSGPDAAPGVIVMSVDDLVGGDVDKLLDGLLVVFNAGTEAVTQTLPELVGRDYALTGIQANGSDDVVKQTVWDAATGTVTVPARTVAVLVDPSWPDQIDRPARPGHRSAGHDVS